MRKAFTLIEMMISISILSILMLFLYKSYAELNISNTRTQKVLQELQKFETIKKIIYLDLSIAKSLQILNQNKQEDICFLQTSHSLHQKINPYVAYIVKEHKLYRLESLRPFKTYPLDAENDFIVEYLGEVQHFRIYRSKEKKNDSFFLVNILFKNKKEIIFKVKALNIE